MLLLPIVRVVHIALGVVAFVLLPVPLFTKKGGKRHVTFGRVYVWTMGALATTGVPLAARGLFTDDWGRRANALFLFFVALLAGETAWMGVRALRAERGGAASRLELVPPALLLAGAIGVAALGLARGVVLHAFFGALGALIALGQISAERRATRARGDGILRHIGGMGVSTITTVTAFAVTNARHVFHLGAFNVFVWITPAVVGAFGIGLAQRSWRARLATERAP